MCLEIMVIGNKDGSHKTFIKNDKNNQFLIFEYNVETGVGTHYERVIELVKYMNTSYTITFN